MRIYLVRIETDCVCSSTLRKRKRRRKKRRRRRRKTVMMTTLRTHWRSSPFLKL
jgi:hypothetical protein